MEVAIVGVGPAGLSAAITAARLGLSYAAIEQDSRAAAGRGAAAPARSG